MIVSRKPDACDEVAAALRAEGAKAAACACHVGHWDESRRARRGRLPRLRARRRARQQRRRLAACTSKLTDVTEELFDKVIAVNLKGPFRLAALVGERMVAAGGGSIINVSSTGAVRPTTRHRPLRGGEGRRQRDDGRACARAWADACASTRSCPGPFLTTIAQAWDMDVFAERARTFPARRAGEADEIVGAALYLASDASSYTTGTILTVDGGAQWSMAGTGDGGPRLT